MGKKAQMYIMGKFDIFLKECWVDQQKRVYIQGKHML
jgi:hypothetical protein